MKSLITFFVCFLTFSSYAVKVTRTLNKSSMNTKDSVEVTVTINKYSTEGIAKIIEDIPVGFKAVMLNTGGGRVLYDEEGKVKVVWLTMPVQDSFQIKYKLIHLGTTYGNYAIKGIFSFVIKDIKEDYSLRLSSLSVKEFSAGVAVGMTKEEKDEMAQAGQDSNSLSYYAVQLGVFSSEKEVTVFNGLPNIHHLMVDGLFKYYTGKLATEEEARKLLITAKTKGFEGAFVVKI